MNIFILYFSKGLANPTQVDSDRISKQPTTKISENLQCFSKQSDVKSNNKQDFKDMKKSNPRKLALCSLM